MKHLKEILEKKTLNDLKKEEKNNGSNKVEPTKQTIEAVIEELRKETSFLKIKKLIKQNGKKSLSLDQIKEISMEYEKRLSELRSE